MIDLNLTLWIQLANFVITLVVLNFLLIKPIRTIIRTRKNKVEELTSAVDTFVHNADTELATYETALSKAREEATLLRKEARAQAEVEEQALLTTANQDAHKTLQEAHDLIRSEAKTAGNTLKTQVKPLVEAALSKILG